MVRFAGIATLVAAVIMIVAGALTWYTVQDQLAAEKITVSDDASFAAGQPVDGPLTAYSQAQVISKHTLESTGGKTYAELDRDDPLRETAMTSSFLRASLFTSVVAFGVAALVIGLGILFVIVGLALLKLGARPAANAQVSNDPAAVPST
jgi:hypothetical protein